MSTSFGATCGTTLSDKFKLQCRVVGTVVKVADSETMPAAFSRVRILVLQVNCISTVTRNIMVYPSFLTTHLSLLTPHLSPLTLHPSSTHYSPLTTHHSPLTPHASPSSLILTTRRSTIFCHEGNHN